MTDTDPAVTGVVLAGGRSTRFRGENKAVATLGGEPLLERVVSTLAAATGRRPVVAVRTDEQRRAYEDALSTSVDFAFDLSEFEGPLAGLFAGVAAVETPWAFVCGCDMPLLSKTAVEWLATRLPAADESATAPGALAVHRPDETVEPLHTLYRRSRLLAAREQLARTDGPRSLLATLDRVRFVPREAVPPRVPLDRSTTNVNTREELAAVAPATVPPDD